MKPFIQSGVQLIDQQLSRTSHMAHFFFPLFFIILLSSPAILQAESADSDPASETADQVADRVQAYYHNIHSLTFSFIQTTTGPISGRPKNGKGNALFCRTETGPLMRWNYNSPDRQVLISDGSILSMYFEKLKQMIITPVSESQADILFALFAGKRALSESFSILDTDPNQTGVEDGSSGGLKVIHLIPRDMNSQINTIHLWIADESLIRRVEIVDHFDTRTTINLSRISINPFKDQDKEAIVELFSFTPPEDTEIIKQ